MTQTIQAPPPSDSDFTIIYNSEKITVSKFKLAIFSTRFRQIPNFSVTKMFSITGTAPIPTFKIFIQGAQGEPLEINDQNAIDLIQLAEEWQVEQIKNEAFKFISENPNLEAIFNKIKKSKDEGSTEGLEKVIATHLDAALDLKSFENFPIDVLARILVHKDRILNNHQKLYNFIMKMLGIHDSKASALVPAIDIRLLTAQEALNLFEHPALQKETSGAVTFEAQSSILRENQALKKEISEIKDTMQAILQRMQKLENFNAKMAQEKKTTVEQTQRQYAEIIARLDFLGASGSYEGSSSKLDSQLDSTQQDLDEFQKVKAEELDAKTQKDLKKTQTTVGTLTKKMNMIESRFEMLAKDSAQIKKDLATINQRADGVLSKVENSRNRNKPIPILYDEIATNGILTKLSQEAGGNVHENHVVTISASSSKHSMPYMVANPDFTDCWMSQNRDDQWIQFDFQNRQIMLQNYTLKTHKYSSGSCHLKSWKIEGSNDTNNWELLDERDTNILNEEDKEVTFECAKKDGTYRYIRLRQTGPNQRGDHMLALTRIEFYGFILQN